MNAPAGLSQAALMVLLFEEADATAILSELNPEERLNADLKHVIGRKVPIRTKAKLRAAAEDHMAIIANEPLRVKTYFQDPPVKYAAGNYLRA